jgi:hypothetical protein
MDATEFVVLSGKLVALGKAGARSAVSRAYYGVFHLAQTILNDIAGETLASGKAHNLVPIFIKSANHSHASAAANLLSDLHAERSRRIINCGMSALKRPATPNCKWSARSPHNNTFKNSRRHVAKTRRFETT